MSRKSKILVAAFVASLFSINVSAQELQSDTISGGQIHFTRDDNHQPEESHVSHKVPARREMLPSVYYNSNVRILTFSSSVSTNILYYVQNACGMVICQGTIYLEEGQDTPLPIPNGTEGECTITIEINGQRYWGVFYVE